MLQKNIFQTPFVIKNERFFSGATMMVPIGYNTIEHLLFSLIQKYMQQNSKKLSIILILTLSEKNNTGQICSTKMNPFFTKTTDKYCAIFCQNLPCPEKILVAPLYLDMFINWWLK